MQIPGFDRRNRKADRDEEWLARSWAQRCPQLLNALVKSAVAALRVGISCGFMRLGVGRAVVGIDHADQTVGNRVPMKRGKNRGEQVEHSRPASRGRSQFLGQDFERSLKDSLGENTDAGFVGFRLAEDCDIHRGSGTPPRTPLYHASPSLASLRMSSTC